MDGGNKVLPALLKVQRELKAPKNQKNTFSNFMYRSCEDILQAARPLCNENGLLLILKDEVAQAGSRWYIHAFASVVHAETGEEYGTSAYAREPDNKTKFDDAQVTGASSSYARKYALCALFAIDDTRDADTDEYQQQKAKLQHRQQDAKDDEAEKKDVLKAIMKDAQQNGLGATEIKAIIQYKMRKNSSKDLSLHECRLLATHYMQYWEEMKNEEAMQ